MRSGVGIGGGSEFGGWVAEGGAGESASVGGLFGELIIFRLLELAERRLYYLD